MFILPFIAGALSGVAVIAGTDATATAAKTLGGTLVKAGTTAAAMGKNAIKEIGETVGEIIAEGTAEARNTIDRAGTERTANQD